MRRTRVLWFVLQFFLPSFAFRVAIFSPALQEKAKKVPLKLKVLPSKAATDRLSFWSSMPRHPHPGARSLENLTG